MKRILAVDLDDTLCERPKTVESKGIEKYNYCTPLLHNIRKVNTFYDEGNTIIIYTARGMSQFQEDVNLVYANLYHLTKNQLDSWGVRYHQLVMGKIHYDLLIDDKTIRPDEL